MFDSLSECMKANDCANRVMLLKDTHTSLKDERIASEPVDDYHNNIGCSALFKEVSYTDGSKRNEFEEKVKDDANASVGAVGVLGHFIAKNFILKDHTGVFTTGLMGCSYALSNKHSKKILIMRLMLGVLLIKKLLRDCQKVSLMIWLINTFTEKVRSMESS
jgi:hypothetical protein